MPYLAPDPGAGASGGCRSKPAGPSRHPQLPILLQARLGIFPQEVHRFEQHEAVQAQQNRYTETSPFYRAS